MKMSKASLEEIDSIFLDMAAAALSLHLVTLGAHAILRTELLDVGSKFQGFDEITQELNKAKEIAHKWLGDKAHLLEDFAEEISLAIPGQVIDYAMAYAEASDQIHRIANAHPDATGDKNEHILELKHLVKFLEQSASAIITDVQILLKKVVAWTIEIEAVHHALSDLIVGSQNSLPNLKESIKKFNDATGELNHRINVGNNQVFSSLNHLEGISLLIAELSLCGKSKDQGLLQAVSGSLALKNKELVQNRMKAEIKDAYDNLDLGSSQLSHMENQVLTLQSLLCAGNQVISSTIQASSLLSAFEIKWKVLLEELHDFRERLDQGELSIMDVVQNEFSDDMAREWKIVLNLSEHLSDLPMNISVSQVDIVI